MKISALARKNNGVEYEELEIIIIVLSSLNFLILLGVLFLLFRKNNGGFEENWIPTVRNRWFLHSSLELLRAF